MLARRASGFLNSSKCVYLFFCWPCIPWCRAMVWLTEFASKFSNLLAPQATGPTSLMSRPVWHVMILGWYAILWWCQQGITFEKARRVTNRSLKMTIWSLGSYLCYEEKLSARGRHYNTIRQSAPFYHYLSGGGQFNTTTRSIWMLLILILFALRITNY